MAAARPRRVLRRRAGGPAARGLASTWGPKPVLHLHTRRRRGATRRHPTCRRCTVPPPPGNRPLFDALTRWAAGVVHRADRPDPGDGARAARVKLRPGRRAGGRSSPSPSATPSRRSRRRPSSLASPSYDQADRGQPGQRLPSARLADRSSAGRQRVRRSAGDRRHLPSSCAPGIADCHVAHAPALTALCAQNRQRLQALRPELVRAAHAISWGLEIPHDDAARAARPGPRRPAGEAGCPRRRGSNPYVAAAGPPGRRHLLGAQTRARTRRISSRRLRVRRKRCRPSRATLEAALAALEVGDEAVSSRLGAPFMQLYTAIKRNEIARFHAAVTDWERAEYLELV